MVRRTFAFLLLAGCSAIPKIRFMDLDAAPDATITDAATTDASSDAGDGQAPVDAGGCPGSPPPGAQICCGLIPCGGPNCGLALACPNCQMKCAVGALCCPNNGGQATCYLDASLCP